MKSFIKIILALSAMFALATSLDAAQNQTRPNIVFVLLDDLRWDALSCTGSQFSKTPNIDRIAKEGALFKNFFVTIPLCSPSRACFLTGQYSHRNGVINNKDHSELSHKLVTFPRLLHDAGYETAYVGKWHMGGDDTPRPGFDRWVGFRGQGVYENPELNIDGKRVKTTGYMTDLLNEHAVNFVKKEHTKPFLLYLSHKAVHGPFTPAKRHEDLYENATYQAPPNANDGGEGKPALAHRAGAKADQANPKAKKRAAKVAAKLDGGKGAKKPGNTMVNQLRALAAVDDGVGELFKALESIGQLDNTVFIFTSDNGYFWGEHGLGDKRWAYDESLRDPLLIRFPKLTKPKTTFQDMVLGIDIAPTLLQLAQVSIPEPMQGASLVPLLKGEAKNWRKEALFEYLDDPPFPHPAWQAVRTDRWKYIHYTDLKNADELYDLQSDPYEMKNLINDPAAKDVSEQMKQKLTRLLKQF